jgi:hypothetical protein
MHCLYCQKKLSLLKLAKGDSFCSPEHFDAHQLQLSKSAYQRLVNDTEEPQKAPLMVASLEPEEEGKPDEEQEDTPVLEADAALAQLSALRAREEPATGWKEPPLCESFAGSWMASYAPDPPAPVPEGHEPVQSKPMLAMPLSEAHPTDGLLNLHLGVGCSEARAVDWNHARQPIPLPESFQSPVARPSLNANPELPQVEPEIPTEPKPDRVPYLTAPSFVERTNVEQARASLNIDASSTLNGFEVALLLDPLQRIGQPGSGAIPQQNNFADASHSPRDTSRMPVRCSVEIPIRIPLILPKKSEQASPGGWHVSNGLALVGRPVARPALEVGLRAARGHDFRPLGSVPVHPGPAAVQLFNRRQTLHSTGTISSLFQSVLETPPQGREPVFLDRSTPAVEAGLRVTLSPSTALDRLSSTTWQNEPAYLPLPTSIADGAASAKFTSQPLECAPECRKPDCVEPVVKAPSLGTVPYHRIAWPQAEFELPSSAGPAPSGAEPGLRLSAPPDMESHPELIANTAFAEILKLTAAPAEGIIFGLQTLTPVASTTLPEGHVPMHTSRIGVSPLMVALKPVRSASEGTISAVRFLPVRRGAVLPTPRAWARLAALPS